jgi:signal transduction histidine kinase
LADEVIGTTKQWSAFYAKERPVMADLIVNEAPEEEISRYYGDKYQKSVLMEWAYEAEDFFPDMGESGRWFFFTAALLRNHHGKITGAIETLQDFTERRKAEEELKTSRYHVAMINKILRHDVTNELSVIRSALRLYGELREERFLKEASDRVVKSVDLIRRMRELETFIWSRGDLKLYNIGSTIKEVMKNYPSIQFSIEGRGQVLADEALNSVIDNIIDNATIHGKADSLKIKIEKARDMYEIRIADNGIGIPDEIKKRIFEENFVFGESARTGVGLYIVKNTIENYGGSVRVEDNTPKGAVFVLKLKGVK